MKPASFDDTSSWIDYKSYFRMCAELNSWSYEQNGIYLGVSLRGMAQGVLRNLPEKDKKDFKTLSLALSEGFSPATDKAQPIMLQSLLR